MCQKRGVCIKLDDRVHVCLWFSDVPEEGCGNGLKIHGVCVWFCDVPEEGCVYGLVMCQKRGVKIHGVCVTV